MLFQMEVIWDAKLFQGLTKKSFSKACARLRPLPGIPALPLLPVGLLLAFPC